SGEWPRNAVPTAPRFSPPARICAGSRGVKLPANTPPAWALGAPARGMPLGSSIVEVPIPLSPVGELAGHRRPKALFIEMPSGLAGSGRRQALFMERRGGLAAPVSGAVAADGLFFPFKNAGLCAVNN